MGRILDKNKRIGEINISKEGYKMKIIEYNDFHNIWIEFQDEHKAKIHTAYQHFKNGQVKNPYHRSIFNIGYIGEGKYNGKTHPIIYKVWHSMIQRCYDPCYLNEHPTYRDCIVCEEWHCFQNFAKWWEENVYNCNNERMELDKDILAKGNKIYNPETCLIVPKRINTLFIKNNRRRGKYPIGVSEYYDKKWGYRKLSVSCNTLESKKTLGYFPLSEPFHAFYAYKQFKENYIKQVADEYKDLIPQRLFEAMYKFEVEIND